MSIDWDEYSPLSLGLGNLLSGTFVMLIKLYKYTSITDKSSSIFQTDFYNYDKIKQKALRGSQYLGNAKKANNPIYIGLIQFLLVMLFICSFANLVTIITSYRTYALMNSEKPNSPSVREKLLNETTNSFIDSLLSLVTFKKVDESFIDDSTNDSSGIEIDLLNNKLVYELIVWDPSKFQLFILSSFNPLNLGITWLISDLSFWKILTVIILTNLQFYYLVDRFWILIKDKQILYQEMFSEYNTKFVKPKTDILKRDVGIDASKFSRYHGQTIIDQTNPYFQNTKSKVFITHDINGKPINTLNQADDDEFSTERKKFESEKIRFELEKEKFQSQVNSSMISEADESWFNSTSTPHKPKIPALNRYDHSTILPSRYTTNNTMSPPKSPPKITRPLSQTSPSRDSFRQTSPSRESPFRQTSPSRESPFRQTSPSRQSTYSQSPSRYSRIPQSSPSRTDTRADTSFRGSRRDEKLQRRPFR